MRLKLLLVVDRMVVVGGIFILLRVRCVPVAAERDDISEKASVRNHNNVVNVSAIRRFVDCFLGNMLVLYSNRYLAERVSY